ncbi:MAG: multicopper oxidase domain-containing protein [Firmicutes bacterium]|nr:multicopper oxidase domain-containing protein [Bacillota bacterium]
MFKILLGIFSFYLFKAINYLKYIICKKKLQVQSFRQTTKLDPASIPKFVNQLVKPPVYKPFILKVKVTIEEKIHGNKVNIYKNKEKRHLYFVDISEFKQQILPEGFPQTTVWGYGGLVKDPETGRIKYSRSSPGATFEAVRGIPVMVKWINKLTGLHLLAVDPTLHWANPNNMPMDPPMPWPLFPPGFPKAQKPIPVVTHLHGGEVPSTFDGHPDAWFTSNGKRGPKFVTSLYTYPNKQQPATLWYHDHTLGITRLNVYLGLAGFYLLRDPENCKHNTLLEKNVVLPSGKYEIPIVIQDRSFNTDGSFSFNNVGVNPNIHPYWTPEFFGDTIMVNGKVWPNLDVEPRQYLFRFLNGSNARFYNLKLSNGMTFVQIGSDGGFLPKPVELGSLLIAPGERADILMDFSSIEPGTSIILQNDANAPFPGGDTPDPNTVGQIMQFTVLADSSAPVKPPRLPDKLNRIPRLIPDSPPRILTLNEVTTPNGPVILVLNGQKWSAPISELPRVGSTEEWIIINLTMDTHPIHLHLVQFQVVSRQNFKAEEYKNKWEEFNGVPPLDHPTIALPIEPYLDGEPISPPDNEKGWKDTVKVNSNEVTRIRVRFAPQDIPVFVAKPGKNLYSFDPTLGPGYVWHCHILDHEDNEMMRPYKVKA